MDVNEWTPILHEIGIITAALSGVIAAISSLKNGQTLNGKHKELLDGLQGKLRASRKRTRNAESKDDWYKAPDV